MVPVNDFLPFCPTDTGTNLLTESEYAATSDRTSGNKPGVASAKLVNKALRQSAYIVSQLAQFFADKTGADLLDDATPAKLLAEINGAILPFAPITTYRTSGTGTHYLSYIFAIVAGSATIGATYTHNSFTYTVSETIASGLFLTAVGTGTPLASGTLTKSTGTGDATLTFRAYRAPIALVVNGKAGGGGGGGSSTSAVSTGTGGTTGSTTSFGSLASASGGVGGEGVGGGYSPGAGGGVTITAPAVAIVNSPGGIGAYGTKGYTGSANYSGGNGGGSGGGKGGREAVGLEAGTAAAANSGGGGGGASINAAQFPGNGGGEGGYFSILVRNPAASYAYVVGGTAAGGSAGASGAVGGLGAGGWESVTEHFQ